MKRTRSRYWAGAVLAMAGAVAGCTDFPSPAQLDDPLLIAVVAEPPVVPPGGTTQLLAVGADATGLLTATGARWSLVETYPGVPPMGTIGADGRYQAPAAVPPLPQGALPIDSVQVTAMIAGRQQTAIKVIAITALPAQNPALAFTVGGASAGAMVDAAAGATVELSVTVDPPAPPGQDRYAWYSTFGTIDAYQSNPAPWQAPEQSGQGFVIVVVRAGAGTSVASIPVRVP